MTGAAETGKTRAIAEMLVLLAESWPGFRALVVRKTRKSLSESFVQTLENIVLPKGHELLSKKISPTNRHSYDFKNGSRIVLGSMETPEAYYSTEWDFVFAEEATEFTEDQWERFFRATRYKTIPHPDGNGPDGLPRYFNRLIGACNPDAPTHWIMRRSKKIGPDGRPVLKLLHSKHEDNPQFTQSSRDRLSRMSGVRYQRLALGLWVAAEGSVWENFDQTVHVIPDHPRVDPNDPTSKMNYEWFVAAVDWGFSNAGCISIYGVDSDGRMYRAWEVMHQQWTIDQWIERAVELNIQWKPRAFVCDSAMPGYIEQFRRAGLPAQPVEKKGSRGQDFVPLTLDLVRDRLVVQGDGKPRLMFVGNQIDPPCLVMQENQKPKCVEEEIPNYVFKRNPATGMVIEGQPEDGQDDHAIDCLRYACSYIERYHQHGARSSNYAPSQSRSFTLNMPDFTPRDGLEQKVLSGELDNKDDYSDWD